MIRAFLISCKLALIQFVCWLNICQFQTPPKPSCIHTRESTFRAFIRDYRPWLRMPTAEHTLMTALYYNETALIDFLLTQAWYMNFSKHGGKLMYSATRFATNDVYKIHQAFPDLKITGYENLILRNLIKHHAIHLIRWFNFHFQIQGSNNRKSALLLACKCLTPEELMEFLSIDLGFDYGVQHRTTPLVTKAIDILNKRTNGDFSAVIEHLFAI